MLPLGGGCQEPGRMLRLIDEADQEEVFVGNRLNGDFHARALPSR